MSSRAGRLSLALVLVGVVGAIAAAIILLLSRHDPHAPPPHTPGSASSSASSSADLSDPLVVEFRETEHNCLTQFNAALARQRRNEIDEVGLALEIDEHVLPAWHALRSKLDSATPSARNATLYAALRRYLSARETGWQAYVAGLRTPVESDARRHFDAYHANDAQADAAAREVGALFRAH